MSSSSFLMGMKTDTNLWGEAVTKNTHANTAVFVHDFVYF